MYLPYGVTEQGQLVYIARKGERLAPHFAHDGKTCRDFKRLSETVALPVYDSFQLHLSGKVWEAVRKFLDEEDHWVGYLLEDAGLVRSFITPYGNERTTSPTKGRYHLALCR